MENKLHILSTATLDDSLIKKVEAAGMHIDVMSFIDTTQLLDDNKEQQIAMLYSEPHVVVFTSANAVKYLPEHNKPHWDIYCIGYATQKAASEKFSAELIKGTAPNAATLADEIIKSGAKEIIFFCGDKRRDELPDKLQAAGISVQEIVVYKTTLTPQHINKQYDGILFFSPSAVESFLHANKIPSTTTLFAIGSTTAGAIVNMSSNGVITSKVPDKKELINTLLEHYSVRSKQILK